MVCSVCVIIWTGDGSGLNLDSLVDSLFDVAEHCAYMMAFVSSVTSSLSNKSFISCLAS